MSTIYVPPGLYKLTSEYKEQVVEHAVQCCSFQTKGTGRSPNSNELKQCTLVYVMITKGSLCYCLIDKYIYGVPIAVTIDSVDLLQYEPVPIDHELHEVEIPVAFTGWRGRYKLLEWLGEDVESDQDTNANPWL